MLALCLLIYLQIRAWKTFDWHMFWSRTEHVNWLYIFAGLAFTYLAYVLRAVRWRIFLKPVKKTTTARLLAPQFVGFAALAMLGRAGEMIRPYIIAKKERLTFTSQVAVWGVERIFDMGSFAVMLAASFLSPDLQCTVVLPVGSARAGVLPDGPDPGHDRGIDCRAPLRRRVAEFLHDRFVGFAPKLAHHVREKVLSFSHGLETIQDLSSALQLIAVSLFMWILVAFAYYAVTHAYPGELQALTPSLRDRADGLQHGRLHAAIAGSRRRLATGDDRHAKRGLPHRARAGGKLRHDAMGRDLHVRHPDRTCDCAPRACLHPRRRRSRRKGRRSR